MKHPFRHLLTAGCSFSYVGAQRELTWPLHLSRALAMPLTTHAMGSQGNDLISRNIESDLFALLDQGIPREQILVGIMWSGYDRMACRPPESLRHRGSQRHMIENPTGWIGTDKPWVIMNAHFEDPLSRDFYRHYYTERWGQIMTLEHIVRVQLLLKSLDIAYFMTQFSWNVMPRGINARDPEWHYLWRQIDFDSWLDIDSCYEWCRDHSGLAMPHPTDDHPSWAQHELFTHRVIVPHLAQRHLIDLS